MSGIGLLEWRGPVKRVLTGGRGQDGSVERTLRPGRAFKRASCAVRWGRLDLQPSLVISSSANCQTAASVHVREGKVGGGWAVVGHCAMGSLNLRSAGNAWTSRAACSADDIISVPGLYQPHVPVSRLTRGLPCRASSSPLSRGPQGGWTVLAAVTAGSTPQPIVATRRSKGAFVSLT
ncbi:hypothetical protein AAFF_G00166370 [Aldrovandia affinis]|uniref:Uncharacterized protein n=1 Tax=Aldrovandia affinis TaxID=143900 RepID=A0AAD7RMT7_9TELE|nr:hypothetical protein AAFF_G00166370 [Aldrovandia affinis]